MAEKSALVGNLTKTVLRLKKKKENVTGGINHSLKYLNEKAPADQGLIGILVDIQTMHCTFCCADGHHSGQCATKKNVDKAVKNLPNTKKLWGTIKGISKSTGVQTSKKRAASQALENWEVKAPAGFKKAKGAEIPAEANGMEDAGY